VVGEYIQHGGGIVESAEYRPTQISNRYREAGNDSKSLKMIVANNGRRARTGKVATKLQGTEVWGKRCLYFNVSEARGVTDSSWSDIRGHAAYLK